MAVRLSTGCANALAGNSSTGDASLRDIFEAGENQPLFFLLTALTHRFKQTNASCNRHIQARNSSRHRNTDQLIAMFAS